jgi:hypothetical protein
LFQRHTAYRGTLKVAQQSVSLAKSAELTVLQLHAIEPLPE